MADYHRMSVAEKLKAHRNRMREPDVRCPLCETQTTVADLVRHAATCPGPRDPHPLSEWVTWPKVLAMGVEAWRISSWVRGGLVRARGPRRSREYLRRDIVRLLVTRKRRSRKKATSELPTSATVVDTDQVEGIEE